MKIRRLILFGLFIAAMVWGTWLAASKVVVWYVPDPTEYAINFTFFDWMVSVLPGAGFLFITSLITITFLGFSYWWILKGKMLWRILLFPIPALLIFVVLSASISRFIHYHEHKFYTYAGPLAEDSLGEDLMEKVAVMRQLVAAAPFPDDPDTIQGLNIKGEVFDVGSYFEVLTNLTEKAGYEMEYVHVGSEDGFPILYSRKKGDSPYQTAQDFIDSLQPGVWSPNGDYLQDWSPSIEMEPTPEAFLELAVLHLIGNQFYLFWHANYNDLQIIASAEKLEELINRRDLSFGNPLGVGMRMKARELDVRPVVEFVQERVVWVDLLTFSKWGGFVREELAFSTEYPHKLLMRESKILIDYECGACF
jgi:hypothetical protein